MISAEDEVMHNKTQEKHTKVISIKSNYYFHDERSE